jgi:hypothetical protein
MIDYLHHLLVVTQSSLQKLLDHYLYVAVKFRFLALWIRVEKVCCWQLANGCSIIGLCVN